MHSLFLSQTHTQTSASKMGQVKAVGVGCGGRGKGWRPSAGSSLGAVPTHPSGIGDGGSCRVGWDVRINIHLPMHMDNVHSCPACFAFIRTNCFRSGGRRAGGGNVPIHRLGVGGCLQLCRHPPPPAWISIPAPSSLFFFLPAHHSGRSGGVSGWERGLGSWLTPHRSWGN